MKKILLFIYCITSVFCQAQNINLDSTFNPEDTGFNNYRSGFGTCILQQPDGKLIVGGSFTNYNGVNKKQIIRLNPDGSVDMGFGINVPNVYQTNISAMNIQADGKLLVSGDFNFYTSNTSYQNLVRLNTDGTLDTSFTNIELGPGTNISRNISRILIQPDGKIVITGDFISYNGTPRKGIARLNADGSLDTSFNPGTGATFGIAVSGFEEGIAAAALQADGKIIISGNFKAYNGVGRNFVARINPDGSLDQSFDPGLGFAFSSANPSSNLVGIGDVAIQADGKILVAGKFSSYNNVSAKSIVRINTDGSLDSSFTSGNGFTYTKTVMGPPLVSPAEINKLIIQPDSKIIIGGNFDKYDNGNASRLIRLNQDGSVDSSFNIGTGFIVRAVTLYDNFASVDALHLNTDGSIFAIGGFTSVNNFTRFGIVKLSSNGEVGSFGTGTGANGDVKCSAVQPDGKVILGGNFTDFNGVAKKGIVRVNIDGSIDNSFMTGSGIYGDVWDYFTCSHNGAVNTISFQPDGKILISGTFKSYNGVQKESILRLYPDGALDTAFTIAPASSEWQVVDVASQPDGKILLIDSTNQLKRFNQDGSADATFSPQSAQKKFILQTDNKIVYFTGSSVKRLNSDGTTDSGFATVTIQNVIDIKIQADGKIIICGNFNTVNNSNINKFVRLLPNGDLDYSFVPPSNNTSDRIYSIALQQDGKIIFGGESHLKRLNTDGTLDTTFNTGNGIAVNNHYYTNIPVIFDIKVLADNKILISGKFNSYNGEGRNNVLRLINDGNLGLKDALSQNFMIYPNPVINYLNIKADLNIEINDIKIYNFLGQEIPANANQENSRVDVSLLPAGNYIINLSTAAGTKRMKFIKG